MPKAERTILDFLRRHIFVLGMAALFAATIALRLVLFPHISTDMRVHLLDWYADMQARGPRALAQPYGNYNIAYLSLMYLFTFLPLRPLYAIKLLSVLGDYLLAGAAAMVVKTLTGSTRKSLVFALLVLLAPLTLLNAAYWGQSDALYTAFLVFSVAFALRGRGPLAILFFSIAFCFKLQAIFLLPFLLILYATNAGFSVFWFLQVPLVLFLSSLPAVVQGSGLRISLWIYLWQMEISNNIYVNYPGVSMFLSTGAHETVGRALILLTLVLCLGGLVLAVHRNLCFTGDRLLLLAAWSAMTCVVFLPGMHERYGFPGEILLLLWLFSNPGIRRLIPVALFYTAGLHANAAYLFGALDKFSPLMGLAALGAWGLVSWQLFGPAAACQRIEPADKVTAASGSDTAT